MKNKNSMATSLNNSNKTQNLFPGSFEVSRIPDIVVEETEILNQTVENNNQLRYKHKEPIVNGFVCNEKSERRDSGFETMTRYDGGPSDTASNGKMPETNLNSTAAAQSPSTKLATENTTSSKKQFITVHRLRSSPLIKRKDSARRAEEATEAKAVQLAKQLFNLEGYDKKDVAQQLSKQDKAGLLVARKYMEQFAFSCVALDESLRLLLKKFALVGETQERERILNHFAKRYSQCNPHFLDGDLDAIQILVCATALLNTDLHGPKSAGRRKMTSKEFANNLARLGANGKDFSPNLLKEIYRSIKKRPLPWCEAESRKTTSSVNKSLSIHVANTAEKSGKSSVVLRSQSTNPVGVPKVRSLPFAQEDDGSRRIGAGRSSKTKTIPRKQGVLYRKAILESDGSKTAKRRRRWKCVVVALQGLELHLAKKESADGTKISLHHCLAEAEASNQSTKRNNVIRLTLANRSVALYQASSKDEQKAWVRSINRNAALLSSAPLSAGIGSQLKFQRPLLPSACSTLPLNKQLEEQQNRLEALCSEMDEHENSCPRDSAPVTEKQFHKDKLDFLQHEVHKYEVYTNSLSELVSSSRRKTRQTLTKSADGEVETGALPESGSLLSVSPSEPGNVGFNNLLSHTESAGSTGDLLETDFKNHPHHLMVGASSLSPTSSLPNLHPINNPRFPETSQKRQQSPGAETFGLVPSVSKTDSGSSSVRLISQDVSSVSPSPLPANTNNSNRMNVFDFNISPSSPEDPCATASYATTGRIDDKPKVTLTASSNTVGRIEVKRHHANDVRYPSPLVVSTSYLSNQPVLFENVTLMRGGCKNIEARSSSSNHRTSPPRVRGRKERRGAARHSYLQAVYDPSHT